MSWSEEHIPEKQRKVRGYLEKLSFQPPYSLLLEGAYPEQRRIMALYWAAALNCDYSPPCLDCALCAQIKELVHRDIFLFDAAEGLKVDTLRSFRPKLNQTAHHRYRVVILDNAQFLNASCANLLLKNLEEPSKWTRFVILAPLRENILPTLVSRSFVLTLSRETDVLSPEQETEKIFFNYCCTGRGWLEISSRKNEVTQELASQLISAVQKEILAAAKGRASTFPLKNCEQFRCAQKFLDKALYCLELQVNAAITLDWLGSNLYSLWAK